MLRTTLCAFCMLAIVLVVIHEACNIASACGPELMQYTLSHKPSLGDTSIKSSCLTWSPCHDAFLLAAVLMQCGGMCLLAQPL